MAVSVPQNRPSRQDRRSRSDRPRLEGQRPALPSPPAPGRRRIVYAQNFLRESRIAARVLDVSSIGAQDVVYEIGPGEGVITEELARRCRHVVAVEKDGRLAEQLRRRFAGRSNVTVFEHDFLEFPLPVTPYKVFANVPFNITAAIVARLTGAPHPPQDAYLGMQREAAERFTGHPAETLSAVRLKPWFEPGVVHHFARTDFEPAPGVDVVMLRLRKRGPPLLGASEARGYGDFVTFGFTAWRPSLGHTLARVFSREQLEHIKRQLGIDLRRTPAEVPFESWLALYRYFVKVAPQDAWRHIAGAEARLRRQQATLSKVHRTRRGARD
jgi:23S rRNA (adenine-N6)-dimethyltransferase